jgi:hypothetical protein
MFVRNMNSKSDIIKKLTHFDIDQLQNHEAELAKIIDEELNKNDVIIINLERKST